MYFKNAYRVLLTRARQGMVIVVPEGESTDHTRKHEYYDLTFDYLRSIGFTTVSCALAAGASRVTGCLPCSGAGVI